MNKDLIEPIQEEEKDIDWKDKYIRLFADMENLKKRTLKEKSDLEESLKIKMMNSILDMDSDLQIALNSYKNPPEGIVLIFQKIKSFLSGQGIEDIQTTTYDENLHEVISVIPSNKTKISSVVSKGYTLNGKVIRYPKIILGKKG